MSSKRYSIRRRLVIGTLASMVVILGGMSITAHREALHESEEIFSARLATSARVLEALVARQVEKATITQPIVIALPEKLAQTTDDDPTEYGHPYETKIAFQVWSERGELLARSASAPNAALSPFVAGFSKQSINDTIWQVFALPSGKVWVLAAEKNEVRQEMVRDLGTSILWPLIAGGILMLLAVNFVLFFNMRSLQELADRISRRDPESLAQIELPEMPIELEPIVNELNDLLHRVKAAFEREKRFIDAAAHEIRTPLAALQIHVQNALHAPNLQERENSLAEAMTGLRRTTKLAEQLLAFSRLTAKVDAELSQVVSLNQVCCEVISIQEPVLDQKGQSLGLDAPQEYKVTGDPYKLQRLVQNLIENASQHGLRRGDIEVAITGQGDRVLLRVSNDGEPIPEEEIQKIFAPYYRIPGRESVGSGLGLAIVREIADQHKADITVSSKPDGQGTVISVSFPAAQVQGATKS